ncbi:MAG: phosphatase PAP2 family protein [Herpetosiphon sp.]
MVSRVLTSVDQYLFYSLNHLAGQNSGVDAAIVGAASLGQYVLVALLVMAWFWPGHAATRRARQEALLITLVVTAVALTIAQVIGFVYFRPRPFAALPDVHLLLKRSTDASFPSDHATLTAALTIPLLLLGVRWWIPIAVVGTVMSVARVAAGTHYPGDLLGAVVVAVVAMALVWAVRGWLLNVARLLITQLQRVRLA